MRPSLHDPHGPDGLRGGYHWAHGEPGLSTYDLMRPGTYSRPRSLSRWPDRNLRSSALVQTDGIAAVQARSDAVHAGQTAYALEAELGHRAYAALMRRSVKRTKLAAATPAPLVLDRLSTGLIRVDAVELAKALRRTAGIIRMADID